jgi:fimbrial isopeptide formation D2 family protein
MSHLFRGRLTALLTALAVAAMTLLGVASSASAANPLPDPTKTGSLTIHKFATPDSPTGLPNNGTQVDTTGLTPVPGATFSIKKVNTIDLTTNQGWSDANALSKAFDPANAESSITGQGYTLAAANGSPVTTDANGLASLSNLPLGLYLVQETAWPSGATPSAPFLVSIPLTDPVNHDGWLYDVHVYPKNATTNVTKTVQDANAIKLGDTVSWTITGDIPNVDTIDGYKIVDKIDPKLDYSSAQVTLSDGTAITQGTDYTVVFDAASHTLTVEFTAAGRAILAAHNTAQVKVVVATKVNAVGEIANTALLYPNQASYNVQPGQPGGPVVTPPVLTKWGSITVLKTDDKGAALAGASFSVYASQADAEAGTNPISLGGSTTFTVAADGTVTISGLRYSDFANGATVAPGAPGYQSYWLVETKAPTGYELLADPIKFDVTAATSTVGVDLTVKNVPSNAGFQLPFTGGSGRTVVYVIGILLILAAGAVVIGRRRAER